MLGANTGLERHDEATQGEPIADHLDHLLDRQPRLMSTDVAPASELRQERLPGGVRGANEAATIDPHERVGHVVLVARPGLGIVIDVGGVHPLDEAAVQAGGTIPQVHRLPVCEMPAPGAPRGAQMVSDTFWAPHDARTAGSGTIPQVHRLPVCKLPAPGAPRGAQMVSDTFWAPHDAGKAGSGVAVGHPGMPAGETEFPVHE